MTSIEAKFTRLSQDGQSAAEAFIDFLLSREKQEEKDILIEEGEDLRSSRMEEPAIATPATLPDIGVLQPVSTGIILAEERMIEEKDDLIDFADINTRFTQKVQEKDAPQQPVKQHRPLDWL